MILDGVGAVHSRAHICGARGSYAKVGDVGERIGDAVATTTRRRARWSIRHPETRRKTL